MNDLYVNCPVCDTELVIDLNYAQAPTTTFSNSKDYEDVVKSICDKAWESVCTLN